MFRLILTDLDDTLLTRGKAVSDYTLDVLNRCRAQGMLVGFSTARGEGNARAFIDRVKPDAVISSGGSLVRLHGEVIHQHAFSEEETRRLIDEALARNCEVTVDTLEGHYWNYAVDPSITMPGWGAVIHTDYEGFRGRSLKTCIELPDPAMAEEIAATVGGCDWLRFTGGNWYKFTKPGATKEGALRMLSGHLGIPLDEIIAFGDDYGDIEMLKLCGRGVAVANAIPEVLSIADAVTADCDDDGVARYLESLLD